jgi:hypothetical protein
VTLEHLSIETMRPRLRDTFRLTANGADFDLMLAEVEDAGQSLNRRAFSLIFSGPSQPILPQGTYRLEHAQLGALELFLVPLGPKQGAAHYQAVFT